MDIILKIPEVITIPDWVWYSFLVFLIMSIGYGIYRIFVPQPPNRWERGG